MGKKMWGKQTLTIVGFYWILAACSTEPVQYEKMKTVESENVKSSEDGESNTNKPNVNVKKNPSQTASDARSEQSGESQEDSTNEQVEDTEKAIVDLNFSWDAPAEADIESYKIFSRLENQAESMMAEVTVNNLNLTAPTYTFQPSEEQQAEWQGQTVYFSIVASNVNGDSEKSMEFSLSFE